LAFELSFSFMLLGYLEQEKEEMGNYLLKIRFSIIKAGV